MSDCGCGSTIDVATLEARQKTVLSWVLVINLATFMMMVAGSFLSGSSALLSGTLDNLGDALTYAASLLAVGASALAKARVAFLKGLLILGAALAVAVQIGWRLGNMEAPIVHTMGAAAMLNLAANAFCLYLLTPLKDQDVNMSSVWECSRNDVFEGAAVIATTGAVWILGSGWPDVIVAIALLVMFLRSATRVLRNAWDEMKVARLAPTT
ncbi:MAG: cation transporter [Gammaproteobacteria bacterium]|jgi:Co/Zn/Cd efflux system component|nr:MAG: cation transporter [Gammaproteobacteria bacterium]